MSQALYPAGNQWNCLDTRPIRQRSKDAAYNTKHSLFVVHVLPPHQRHGTIHQEDRTGLQAPIATREREPKGAVQVKGHLLQKLRGGVGHICAGGIETGVR